MFFASEALGTVVTFVSGGFLLQLFTHFDTVDASTLVYTGHDCVPMESGPENK